MAQSFFQPNPDTGQPFTLDEALKVGMPQQGGLSDIMVNRQGVGGQMFGNSEPTGLAGMLGQQVGPQFDPVQGQAQPRKPNMLKNIGMGLVGGALDGVARWGGAKPGYANALEQQQEQIKQEREWLSKLRQTMAMKQYEKSLEGPSYTDFEKTLLASGMQPDSPQWREANRRKVENSTDPILTYTSYDDNGQAVINMRPRSQVLGGSQQGGRAQVGTGIEKSTGRQVIKYSDGTIEYAD